MQHKGRLIAVTAHESVGGSNLAANIAAHLGYEKPVKQPVHRSMRLSRNPKNPVTSPSVCLISAPGAPNTVGQLINARSRRLGEEESLLERNALSGEAAEGLLVSHTTHGFRALPGTDRPGMPMMSMGAYRRFLDLMLSRFDYVIVDAAGSTSPLDGLGLVGKGASILALTTQDPEVARKTELVLKLLGVSAPQAKVIATGHKSGLSALGDYPVLLHVDESISQVHRNTSIVATRGHTAVDGALQLLAHA